MQAKISHLGKGLIWIGKRLKESPNRNNDWHSMWWGLVGAIYSLGSAIPPLPQNNRSRNPKKIVDDAEKILKSIADGAIPRDKKYDSWIIGYYLNGAEFRIASTLHKLLKACYDCSCTFNGNGERRSGIQGLFVPELVRKLLDPNDIECNKCRATQITLSNRTIGFLQDFRYRDLYLKNQNPSYKPKRTIGDLLARVYHQVNDLKHKHMPLIDRQGPRIRVKNTLTCLSGICAIFRDIAKQRGKLHP